MRWAVLVTLLGCGRVHFAPVAADAAADATEEFVGDGQRRLALGFYGNTAVIGDDEMPALAGDVPLD